MNIEDIYPQPFTQFDYTMQNTPLLAARLRDVMRVCLQDLETREQHVPISPSIQGPGLSESNVEIRKSFGDPSCLIELPRTRLRVDDLLQTQDVGVKLFDHANHAIWRNRAVNSAAFVSVI